MEPCFTKLTVKSTIRQDLLKFCEDGNQWIDPTVGTFFQKNPPRDLIFSDPFLQHICDNCLSNNGYNTDVKIYRITPWTHYMLHTDEYRSSSINLLINDESDSISYFKASDTYNKLHIKILELKYEQDSYYLFNSKIPHAITNRDSTRYLLSITLKDNFYSMSKYLKTQLVL